MVYFIFLLVLFACWGSFLNILGYRLVHYVSIISPRSYCIHCCKAINWYDLIPILSWFILRGKCRYCHAPISLLYPAIELLSAILFTYLYFFIPSHYFFAYFIFFSALIIIIRSDLETMLISQYTTLFLLPVAFVLSYYNCLPINLFESFLGAILGYLFLFFIAKFFTFFTKKEGLGEGDIDMLAMIGSFTGIIGCWTSITMASCTGAIVGTIYMALCGQKKHIALPFGPFLAAGAIFFVFFQHMITHLFFMYA